MTLCLHKLIYSFVPFTEDFNEVFGCIALWKACGVDSVYALPTKRCQPIRKAVNELSKKIVEWTVADRSDDEKNWLPEGRTVLQRQREE